MKEIDALRAHVVRLLAWEDAHVGFSRAVKGVPPELRGASPEPLPHTLWQLLEHLRLAQLDILEFCRNPDYAEQRWPDDYWPSASAPPSAGAWNESVRAFRRDLDALQALASDPTTDLFAKIPHGTGQTYLREFLLVADHTSYHVGQIVLVRQRLGIWPPG